MFHVSQHLCLGVIAVEVVVSHEFGSTGHVIRDEVLRGALEVGRIHFERLERKGRVRKREKE